MRTSLRENEAVSGSRRYENIIFDFDGVLAETNAIRLEGFRTLFRDYPAGQVERLLGFARLNGGMSRYEKIRHFFEDIRGEAVSGEKIGLLALQYSASVKQAVIDAAPVKGSCEFLSGNYRRYNFALVSGSDQKELREVCRARGIEHYFMRILGSPVRKEKNLRALMEEMKWDSGTSLLVGDSLNDLIAATDNGIDFVGRNSGLVDWNSLEDVDALDDLSQMYSYLVARTRPPVFHAGNALRE